MPRKKKSGDSLIKETSEKQNNQAAEPPAGPEEDMVVEDGIIRTSGKEGGMFVPGAIARPATSAADDDVAALRSEIERLQTVIDQKKAAQDQTRDATPTAARAAPTTPIFGMPDQPGHTPLAQPQPERPTQPPTITHTPQQPQQPPQTAAANPDPTLPAHGYIAVSRKGEGFFALVIDGLTKVDLDYIDFMAKYTHEHYPGAIPEAHPAPLTKFAINHLLRDIRQEIAKTVHCGKCRTEFSIKAYTCPRCGAPNRCTQCGLLIGNGNIYI